MGIGFHFIHQWVPIRQYVTTQTYSVLGPTVEHPLVCTLKKKHNISEIIQSHKNRNSDQYSHFPINRILVLSYELLQLIAYWICHKSRIGGYNYSNISHLCNTLCIQEKDPKYSMGLCLECFWATRHSISGGICNFHHYNSECKS